MKNTSKFICLFFMILSFFSNIYAFEEKKFYKDSSTLKSDFLSESMEVKRISINLDQLVLMEEGMFVNLSGNLFPVEYIGYDTQGYYAVPLYWICKNGHIQPLHTWGKCRKCGEGPIGR